MRHPGLVVLLLTGSPAYSIWLAWSYMSERLPKNCFISHSYDDEAARVRLVESLGGRCQPRVFPPITVDPDQFVSNRLIEAILDCEGLIYLRGGKSDRSFWVAFERDYALRAGKEVFSANVDTLTIEKHKGRPLDLAAFASYSHADRDRVLKIADHLKEERYFDLWVDTEQLVGGERFQEQLVGSIRDRIDRGGYVIVFWTHAAAESEWIRHEIQLASEGISDLNDRVIFALLDKVPIPEFWERFHEPAVQLYGDAERSETQRVDDLVVRLYWLIYRKTGHRELDTDGR